MFPVAHSIQCDSGGIEGNSASEKRRRIASGIRRGLLLALLLAIAVALRIHHLERWLPDLFEEAVPVLKARGFWGGEAFDFNPHFFHYPELSFYAHFAFQAAVFCVGFLSRDIPSLEAFRALLKTDWHAFVLLGRAVTVLRDEVQAEGTQAAHWDGADERGQPVGAGVYFVRLDAGGQTRLAKMTMVR